VGQLWLTVVVADRRFLVRFKPPEMSMQPVIVDCPISGPSYAGGSTRADFYLKDDPIVVETKVTTPACERLDESLVLSFRHWRLMSLKRLRERSERERADSQKSPCKNWRLMVWKGVDRHGKALTDRTFASPVLTTILRG
jgi:hypothetical protein